MTVKGLLVKNKIKNFLYSRVIWEVQVCTQQLTHL